MSLRALLSLEPHGPDTFVGTAAEYPWGGLYGGHIVAQALTAAAETVGPELLPHSLRAYFIRRGSHAEPVRYEVDRIRNGRSFATRRVVARQTTGAILNLEASFHRDERSELETSPMRAPVALGRPDELGDEAWSTLFQRRFVAADGSPASAPRGGRALAWLRVNEELGDDDLLQRCALAYLSDDLPADAVRTAVPGLQDRELFVASLDHTVWFHRPVRADGWHLHDLSCQTYIGGRGLTIGQVYDSDGGHAATVAQEVLIRVPPTVV